MSRRSWKQQPRETWPAHMRREVISDADMARLRERIALAELRELVAGVPDDEMVRSFLPGGRSYETALAHMAAR